MYVNEFKIKIDLNLYTHLYNIIQNEHKTTVGGL